MLRSLVVVKRLSWSSLLLVALAGACSSDSGGSVGDGTGAGLADAAMDSTTDGMASGDDGAAVDQTASDTGGADESVLSDGGDQDSGDNIGDTSQDEDSGQASDTGVIADTSSTGDGGQDDTGAASDTSQAVDTSQDNGPLTDLSPADTGVGGCLGPPAGADEQAGQALTATNTARLATGVPCAAMDSALNLAAQNHCDYVATNRSNGACWSAGTAHRETVDCPDFTGVNFWDRMSAAGYAGGPSFENMHFNDNAPASLRGWIDSVWHRTPILSPWIRHLGYGHAASCDTMDFGSAGESTPVDFVAVYPYGGQVGVPRSFDGSREGPNPPAPETGWLSGYPITIFARQAQVSEHTLTVDGSDDAIGHVWLSQNDTADYASFIRNEHVMYANDPLEANTTYRVRIVGTHAGDAPLNLDWTFTTSP